MLDLSQPLGEYEGLLCYGDHMKKEVIYYFPDQVRLSRIPESPNGKAYEINLQIFKEGDAVLDNLEALRASSGSILSMSVECSVEEDRKGKALQQIARHLGREPGDLYLSLPPWKSGKADLILLDATTQDNGNLDQDTLVEAIIGSKVPSLNTGDLKSIFNVRLGRKGTALVAASLQGDRDQRYVAGVLFHLETNVLRPALDMKMSANLSRVQEKIGHIFSANVGYPPYVGVGVDLEFLKTKLEEDGDIKVEVISQVSDPAMQKMVRETIDQFKDKILDKLFEPAVMPTDMVAAMVSQLGNKMQAPSANNIVQLGYKFKHETNFHDRVIEVDFRERSAISMIHNPQAQLWALGSDLEMSNYVQVVTFSDLWRENTLHISMLHDFAADGDDLLSAEVLIWRRKDGLEPSPAAGHFSIPETADHLVSFTFTRLDFAEKVISWISEPEEPAGYIYQVKLTYDADRSNINTPAEIFSRPVFSNSRDLVIIPQVLAPARLIEMRLGGTMDPGKVKAVDIKLRIKDAAGQTAGSEVFTLGETQKEATWAVRRPLNEQVFLEQERHYYFRDNRPSLRTEAVEVLEDELIVQDPFDFYQIRIIPVVLGADPERILELLLELDYQAGDSDYRFRRLFRSSTFPFLLEEINLNVIKPEDKVHWKASVVTKDGRL
ncbi:MAG: hypothetical protein KDD15_29765, partial [Lewinella sp.]|nr:hypothetical protein [Lewinella sp.]